MNFIQTTGHLQTAPYDDRTAPSSRLRRSPQLPGSRRRSSHVLIITDSEQDMESAAALLRTQLFRVTFASGWQGYYQAQACLPDLILVDGDMLKMDSFMIARLLKQSPGTHAIPIIFLAKRQGSSESLQAFACGAVDCMAKPFYPEELLARISIRLRLAFSLRQLPAATGEEATVLLDNALLRNALDIIQNEMGSLHAVRDLAKRIGTHERRLSAIFKSNMGMSAHKFILERKMETACRLLAETGMLVHEVAEHIGFHSVCNFTVAFRRQQGMTPTAFRHRLP